MNKPLSMVPIGAGILCCATAWAQDSHICRLYVGSKWTPTPADSIEACARRVGEAAQANPDHTALQFGSWDTTLLSSDLNFVYQSSDGGHNWSRLYTLTPTKAPAMTMAPPTAEAASPSPPDGDALHIEDVEEQSEASFADKWHRFMSRRWFVSKPNPLPAPKQIPAEEDSAPNTGTGEAP